MSASSQMRDFIVTPDQSRRPDIARQPVRFRMAEICCAVIWLHLGCFWSGVAAAQELNPTANASLVTTETAEYRGLVRGQQIVDGNFTLRVVRRGETPSLIDWSQVNIAMEDLAWEKQALIAGTTADERIVLMTQRDSDLLTGKWSALGSLIGKTTLFDLQLPPALNNRLLLDLPLSLQLECRQGLVQQGDVDESQSTRLWILELGGVSTATIMVSSSVRERTATPPRYEIETEFRARRDGIFLRADLTLEGPFPAGQPLKLQVPPSLEVQSISLQGGFSPGGMNLRFERDAHDAKSVLVQLDSLPNESNISLRIRGFEAAAWKNSRAMPRLRVVGAIETKRTLILRIEPPLQLQDIESGDLLQTALTSDDTLGETWKFEARDPNTELTVNIQLPDAPLFGEMFCLTDALPDAGWTAAVFYLQVENGSRFNATFQLPDDWKLISVSGPDNDSKIASWKMEDQVLSITWQNPLTRNSPRQLRLVARSQVRRERTPFRIVIPQVRGAFEMTVNYQILLPEGANLQLLEGEGWRLIEGGGLLPVLAQFREAKERMAGLGPVDIVTLRSSGESRSPRLLATITSLDAADLDAAASSSSVPSTGNDSLSTAGTEAQDSTASQPSVENGVYLELLTMAGQSHQRDCVQQAKLKFDQPVDLDTLKLSLDAECRLSAVKIDGEAVTVFRVKDEIVLPAEAIQASLVQLTYVTPTTSLLLEQRSKIPLPRSSIPVRNFRWSIDVPAPQQLSRVNLPGLFQLNEVPLAQRPMLFGPLSREADDSTFNPFSWKHWKRLLHGESQARDKTAARSVWHYVAPTVGETAEFVTWNSALTRSYAWVALLACMTFGMTARQFRMAWLRKVSVLWVLLLIILVTLTSQSLALIFGGMLAGSLLSLILPRRWLLQRDLFSRTQTNDAKRAVVTASLMLIVLNVGLQWSSGVQADDNLLPAIPATLIRSARYELQQWSPVPQVKALFEVLVRETTDEVYLRLPLLDVVLPPAADCLVNGDRRPLIPATSGDAVLVRLGQGQTLPGEVIAGTDWRRCEVRLNFSIRTFDSSAEGGTGVIRGVVPSVLDSVLTIPADLAPLNWQRYGETSMNIDQVSVVQLGAIGRLALYPGPTNAIPALPVSASVHTAMDVSALRIRCQSRIQAGPNGWPARMALTFPPGSLVNSVSGPNLIDTIDTSTAEDPAQLTVRLRPNGATAPISLSYEFPANSVSGSDVTIPAIKLLGGTQFNHAIGISGPPLTTLTLPNRAGQSALTIDEWQLQAESGRPRPTLALQLKSPAPFSIEWIRKHPQRAASVQEDMRILRETISWVSIVKMNVTDAPTFRHQFQLDPAIHLESVSSGLMGNDGAVRFTRTGKLVTLYLTGGHVGERVFHFKGHLSSQVDAWTSIPELIPLDSVVSERVLAMSDETGWDLELESAPGKNIPITSEPPMTPPGGPRVVGMFRDGAGERPRRIRISVPPRAIQASTATLVQPVADRAWDLVATIHISSPEAPLKKVVLQIPPGLKNLRVRQTVFQHSLQTVQNQTQLVVRIPERYSNQATFSVSARYVPELPLGETEADHLQSPVTIPQLQVLSASTTAQYLLMDADSALQPVAITQLPTDSVPLWFPAEWKQKIRTEGILLYQQSRPEIRLQKRVITQTGGEPVIRLEETALWALNSERLNGVTRWWITTRGQSELPLALRPGMRIESISALGTGQLGHDQSADGTLIRLPSGQEMIPLTINWSAESRHGDLQLLNAAVAPPLRRLVSVVHPRNWKVISRNDPLIPRFTAILDRWDSLLGCLKSGTYSQETNALLLRNVEHCLEMAEQNVNGSTVTELQKQRSLSLALQWEKLQADLAPIPDAREIDFDASDLIFSELMELNPRELPVEWISPVNQNWSGSIQTQQAGIQWQRLFFALLFLSLAAWLLWKFPKQFAAFREQASSHPAWTFTLFGAVWWLWFSPSAFGLLIMLVTWIIAAIHRYTQPRSIQDDATFIAH